MRVRGIVLLMPLKTLYARNMSNSGKELTKSQRLYCANRANGETTKVGCYMEAFPRCKSRDAARQSYQMLEKQPHIQEEIKRLQDATETNETLSRQEKRIFLARVVRANLANIDPDDEDVDGGMDLASAVTRRFNKEGDHISTSVSLPSKLAAIEIDNKMAGHNEPDEVNHHLDGGVMLVPTGGDNLDEWEKAAVKQQAAMRKPKDEKTS